MKCPNCGAEGTGKFCMECGTTMTPTVKFCPDCGNKTTPGVKFCSECGYNLSTTSSQSNSQSVNEIPQRPPSQPVNTNAIPDDADMFDDPSGTLLMLPRGMKLGDYEVVRMIGKGGMGVVYEALFHGLDHPVTRAIKTVPPLVSSNPKAISDLKREVRIAQELGHPNIVKTYNLEQIRDKTFIVMEYVKGQDLASYLDDQPDRTLPLERVIELLQGVAEALDFAHSLNPPVVHRDMKPENLLLDSRDGRLKITDFGLAREVADTMTRLSVLSQSSGTPLYMPYEQFMGDIPTPSVDIYALGIIAYEMLNGKPPFFRGDIMAQHREKTPRKIEGVSKSVMTALQTVLAKDQEDRYQKATIFVEALSKPSFLVCPECAEARDVERFSCPRCGNEELCLNHLTDGKYCPECGKAVAEEKRLEEEERQREADRLRLAREEEERKQRKAEEQKRRTPGAITNGPLPVMQFAYIPGGTFLMGAPEDEEGSYGDERPQHEVTLKPFHIMTTPVTQTMWESVMGDNPSSFKGGDRPVESVSRDDIQKFLKKLNSAYPGRDYRLPSEAEWEYSCRAGTTTRFYTDDSDSDLKGVAWYADNSGNETHPVGEKKPNTWGLFDMHGNVNEWCADVWHEDYNGAPSDGSVWTKGGDQGRRVLRGGSWVNYPEDCRSAYRYRYFALSSHFYNGFRLVFA